MFKSAGPLNLALILLVGGFDPALAQDPPFPLRLVSVGGKLQMPKAEVRLQPPLETRLAQLAHVHHRERTRAPHFAIVATEPIQVRRRRLADLKIIEIGELLADMAGVPAKVFSAKDVGMHNLFTDAGFLELDGTLPLVAQPLPIAALSLGSLHFAIDLNTFRPSRRGPHYLPRKISAYPPAGRECEKNLESGALPGGMGNSGLFRGRLIGEIAPDGVMEPLIGRLPRSAHAISGRWRYENGEIKLQIFNSALQTLNQLAFP